MKKVMMAAALMAALAACGPREESMDGITARVFALAEEKFAAMDRDVPLDKCVASADSAGNLKLGDLTWWTSGFFPGSLWLTYEYTGNEDIREMAERRTKAMEPLKTYKDNHDIGFMMNCSFGNALMLTGDTSYVEPLVTAAKSLLTRFNPKVGCTMSWNPNQKWKFPVIIDNMMNLELLYLASKLTGSRIFASIADIHAVTTIRNHFREDCSTFHVIDYDPETGKVRHRNTAQGLADSSAWARGESWALYGYTMAYRETENLKYVQQAEEIAGFIMSRLPEDGIPYWDYDAPGDLRDASAGAIAASALVELSELTGKDQYLKCAERILRTLAGEEYLTKNGEYAGFLLKHSVGSKPAGSEVDVPLSYADYYFLEALIRFSRK